MLCGIINHFFNVYFVEIWMKKKTIWNMFLDAQTSILVSQTAWIHHCILQIYFCSLNMKYTSSILFEILTSKDSTSLAKWLSVCLPTKWLWVPAPLQLLADITPVSSKEFLGIQASVECGFTLVHTWHDMNIQSS